MNRPLPLLILPLLLLLAAGCGPIRSTVGIIQAEQVLKEARELGAAEVAPYPMAVAEELVRKAVEEQGYADYSTSWQLATEARDLVQATLAALPRADVQGEQPGGYGVVEPPLTEEPVPEATEGPEPEATEEPPPGSEEVPTETDEPTEEPPPEGQESPSAEPAEDPWLDGKQESP
jgi:outer membrane biosynthesis protein TonB